MARRTFGWIQNPGKLANLKKTVSVFKYNSKYNVWLREVRLPLLKKYHLISNDDYLKFSEALSNEIITAEYMVLKGKGAGKQGRTNAICTGLIQATIDGQQDKVYRDDTGATTTIKKPYTDDWTAEGFLRWAISCGLLIYDGKNDTCSLSELGEELANTTDGSTEEREFFTKSLLSYPPVCRVL